MISGIIMAAGYGRRMGKNKLLLPYKNKPIIEHVIDASKASRLDEIIMVARDEKIIEIGNRKNLKTVINDNAKLGQSQSIKLGIENSNRGEGYMFLTGDQPLINSDIINLLISKFHENKNKIIVPVCSGRRSSPVIFPYDLRDELLGIQGDTGGKNIINNYLDRVEFVAVEDSELLMDIDTYEDYIGILNSKA